MVDDYAKARKLGRRQVREALLAGRYPYLSSLDYLVPRASRAGEVSLGTMEIPLSLVAGTVTEARGNVFSHGFMPIADAGTEFATKWSMLYDYQVREGISEPVTVYEFLQRFYVAEGNKRVSVLRYLGNPSVTARVTRVLPREADEFGYQLYREFLDFWRVAPVWGLHFSRLGSHARLAELLGLDLEHAWPEDVTRRLAAALATFERAFVAHGGGALSLASGDAFLVYLQAYATSDPLRLTPQLAAERVDRIWDGLVVAANDDAIDYLEQPTGARSRLVPSIKGIVRSQRTLNVDFIYDRNPRTSGWVALHEQGRLDLERRMGDRIHTVAFEDCAEDEAFRRAVDTAAEDGVDLVVTVSPRQFDQTLRAAVAHPDLRLINCSINLSSGLVRTFHARMYEAKFVMGAVAASLAENHRLGYVAFSPIYGSIAEINAFAAGAQLVDPLAEVHLKWLTAEGNDWHRELREEGVRVIAGRDHPDPTDPDEPYGLFRELEDGTREQLAVSVWDWGRYYELLVRSIHNDAWSRDASEHRDHAVNYWWGMSSGVVRLDLCDGVPEATRRLAGILERAVVEGYARPFEGAIFDQKGRQVNPDGEPLPTNDQIAGMRWLADNVVGRLPKSWELSEAGREDVRASGVLDEQTDAEE